MENLVASSGRRGVHWLTIPRSQLLLWIRPQGVPNVEHRSIGQMPATATNAERNSMGHVELDSTRFLDSNSGPQPFSTGLDVKFFGNSEAVK